jgi:putative transposase
MNRNSPKYPRLSVYDYSWPGIYSITMCISDREQILSQILDERVLLTIYGEIVQEEWIRSFEIRKELKLDTYIIMPDHMHGIVQIVDDGEDLATLHKRQQMQIGPEREFVRSRKKSLGSFVAQFKAVTAKRVNILRSTPGKRLWQPDYFDRIIRSEDELFKTREYIINNPIRWTIKHP